MRTRPPIDERHAVSSAPPGRVNPAPTAAGLEVRLLGTPTVMAAGSPVPISRRKVSALLYRLAAAPDPVPREHLSFLFWPDTRELAARRQLTGLLSHLRRALPDPDLLLAEDDHVWLDRSRTWSDVLELEALHAGQPQAVSPAVCQQVVDLYRGSFLGGFSLPDSPEFETWLTLERASWEQRYLVSLSTLGERATQAREYQVAIDLLQRYLEADDLAEEMHRHLIEIYGAMGDRHGAARQYERCVEILDRELGVEPLPETQAAYQAALEGSLVAPPPARCRADIDGGSRPGCAAGGT